MSAIRPKWLSTLTKYFLSSDISLKSSKSNESTRVLAEMMPKRRKNQEEKNTNTKALRASLSKLYLKIFSSKPQEELIPQSLLSSL